MKKIILVVSIICVLFLVGCNLNENISGDNQTINSGDTSNLTENRAEDVEYKEDVNNQTEDVKNALVGDYKLQTAYTSQSVDDYQMYWGSSYRYGGGLKFNKDGTFEFTLGAYADTSERSGMYTIDMSNNEIIYTFYNGTIEYGAFDYSNGKINEVLYVDISYVGNNENDKLTVKLIPNDI